MSIRPRDILFYAGGSVLAKHGTVLRKTNIPARRVEDVLSTTRAAPVAYTRGSDGIWRPSAVNNPRIEYYDLDGDGIYETAALLVSQTRTNIALWCRDMTNAAWVKTNITAAKDQVGIDGAANAASKLTATSSNGTCLQSITTGSITRVQRVAIRRITGSGNVQMTMDNGATWTTLTFGTSYSLVAIPSQVLANPIIGFRIVTSGDAIAVDFVQNEAGSFPSSPIATTTVAVTRATETLTVSLTGEVPTALSMYLRFVRPLWAGLDSIGDFNLMVLKATSSTHLRFMQQSGFPGTLISRVTGTGGAGIVSQAMPAGSVIEMCAQVPNTLNAQTRLDVGSGFGSYSGVQGPMVSPIIAAHLGHLDGATFGDVAILSAIIARGTHEMSDFRAVL